MVKPPLVRTVAYVSPLRGRGIEGTLEVTVDGPSHTTRRLTPAAIASTLERPDPGGPEPANGVALAVAPPAPVADAPGPGSLASLTPDGTDDPALPDEARAAVARDAGASTRPVEAAPGQVLHVRFRPVAPDQVVAGFQALKELIHERPGSTGVVLHIPAGPAREQEMTLRVGVAYDAELVAEAGRRIGTLAELRLA